jgi:hypothetical protein
VEQDGATYLVAMLGRRTNWVRNVAANGGAPCATARRTIDSNSGVSGETGTDLEGNPRVDDAVTPDHPVFEVVKKV